MKTPSMALFKEVLCFLVIVNFTQICVNAETSKLTNSPKTPWNATVTDRLKHELLMHYDKFARPAQHYNTTTVNVGITVRHIDLNELKNTFTVNCWIRMIWKDDKLKWNSSAYEGLTTLHVADHEIWQPDIVPYNSAAGSTIDHYANTNCIVNADGTVLWVPPAQFVVFCELDLRLWPFDTQTCYVQLGSWTYHGFAVDLKIDEAETDVQLLIENTEWELISLTKERKSKKYKCCPEPYIDVTFNITVKRKSPTYKDIIITPAFAIIVMTLLNFWLPPQAGEKILLNGCTAIIICMFLLYFSQKCPAMGDHTPLIVLFYSSSLYVISFCMIGSVCVLWLARTTHYNSLPWVLKHPLTGWLGRWLGLSTYINQTSLTSHTTHTTRDSELHSRGSPGSDRDNQDMDHHHEDGDEHRMIMTPITPSRTSSTQAEWVLLAAALDRVMFVFWALIFAILAIAYSV